MITMEWSNNLINVFRRKKTFMMLFTIFTRREWAFFTYFGFYKKTEISRIWYEILILWFFLHCWFFTNRGYISWVYVVFYFLCQFECLKFGNKSILHSVLYKEYLADFANKWHKSALWKYLPIQIWMEIEA